MKKSLITGLCLVLVGAAVLITRRPGMGNSNQGSSPTPEQGQKRSGTHAPISDAPAKDGTTRTADTAGAEAQLSAPVRALINPAEAGRYSELLADVHALNLELTQSDTEALMDLLTWPNERFPQKMRAVEINAIKNDILNKLLRQEILPEGIGSLLVEMAADSENDPVWRDYCIQFMQPYYERVAAESMEHGAGRSGGTQATATSGSEAVAPPDDLGAVREAMFSALNERDGTLAGTSLIGLENLSRTHDEFDRNLIASSAVEIAADETASAESRLTALRLAADFTTEDTELRRGTQKANAENSESSSLAGGEYNSAVAEAARVLAQTGETVYLRSAAIVTLGQVGSADDRELIESYLLDDNRQIAMAAAMALEEMDE